LVRSFKFAVAARTNEKGINGLLSSGNLHASESSYLKPGMSGVFYISEDVSEFCGVSIMRFVITHKVCANTGTSEKHELGANDIFSASFERLDIFFGHTSKSDSHSNLSMTCSKLSLAPGYSLTTIA
jgi:hypothetical protein